MSIPIRRLLLPILVCALAVPALHARRLDHVQAIPLGAQAVGDHVSASAAAMPQVGPGATLRYDISAGLLDQSTVPGTVTLHLPAAVTIAGLAGRWSCQWTLPSGSGGDVVCTTTLGRGNTFLDYSIYATVPATVAVGTVLNASVTFDLAGTLTVPLTTTVVPSTDLSVTATTPADAKAGVLHSLTVRLTNTGSATAFAPTFTATAGAANSSIRIYWTYGYGSQCYQPNPYKVVCDLADLAPGASVDIPISAAPDPAASSDTVHIVGSINNSGPHTADDTIDAVTQLITTVTPKAETSISTSQPRTGYDYVVASRLTSDGPAFRDYKLTYDTPPHTVFESVNPPSATCVTPAAGSPGRVTCTSPPVIAPTYGLGIGITVRTDTAGPVTHTFTSTASNMTAPVTASVVANVAAADVQLSATLAASSQRILTGGEVAFTLSVRNAGHDASSPLTVTAAVPSTLQVLDVSSGISSCAVAPQVRCSMTSLAGGTTETIRFRARAGSVPGIATVTGAVTTTDKVITPLSAAVTIAAPVAPLTAALTADRSVVPANDRVVYTLKVTNSGPDDATTVVADIATAGESSILSTNATGFLNCTVHHPVAHCEAPLLSAGNAAIATITLASPATDGTISATATVTSATGSPQTTSISTPVISRGPADVAVRSAAPAQSGALGQPLLARFTVTNLGSSDAANVAFDVTAPPELSVTSVSTTRGTCVATHCSIGTLTSGATADIMVSVVARHAGTAVVRGQASTSSQQSPGDNDAQEVTVTVAAPRNRAVRH